MPRCLLGSVTVRPGGQKKSRRVQSVDRSRPVRIRFGALVSKTMTTTSVFVIFNGRFSYSAATYLSGRHANRTDVDRYGKSDTDDIPQPPIIYDLCDGTEPKTIVTLVRNSPNVDTCAQKIRPDGVYTIRQTVSPDSVHRQRTFMGKNARLTIAIFREK